MSDDIKPMYIYLLTQSWVRGYDTYDSCVVYAESERAAQLMTPSEYCGSSWPKDAHRVEVQLLGEALPGTKAGLILASFNAG
jgi:hypothetical protein